MHWPPQHASRAEVENGEKRARKSGEYRAGAERTNTVKREREREREREPEREREVAKHELRFPPLPFCSTLCWTQKYLQIK